MGTKKAPGKYDCYAKAELDEPFFVLLARDEHAPEVVRYWVALKNGIISQDFCSAVTPERRAQFSEKGREALSCADAMQEWRAKNHP